MGPVTPYALQSSAVSTPTLVIRATRMRFPESNCSYSSSLGGSQSQNSRHSFSNPS